jgi:hypothetical protein
MQFRDAGFIFPGYKQKTFGMEDGVFLFGGTQVDRNLHYGTHLHNILMHADKKHL